MKQVLPGKIEGSLQAPSSKSMAQRAVAAAALGEGRTEISNFSECADALASLECAKALGARIEKNGNVIAIVGRGKLNGPSAALDCNESGLCLRMFTPIAALFGREIVITGKGSLLSRPVGMVQSPLEELGASCRTTDGKPPVRVKGPIRGGKLEVDGSASSQFITGLLMALPLCKEDSEIRVSNPKSKPYLRMTVSLLEKFGIRVKCNAEMDKFEIKGGQKYKPAAYIVEGDWSAAAFLLVAGATAGKVRVSGLEMDSLQADRAIVDALKLAGAKVRVDGGEVIAEKSELKGFEFDATDCPDLFPPLVALACLCRGKSRIHGALRLKGKESDRAAALVSEFAKLGGKVSVSGDVMEIEGCALVGGEVDSHNDHRIAMACAIAALRSQKGVEIEGAECVSKSYPKFFEDLLELQGGGREMDPFSFGDKFRVRVFGSSHGEHVGVEIDGCPAGVQVSASDVQLWLDRRKPGASPLASARKEEDAVVVESGIENGKTTGGKIRMLVRNTDAKSKDYEKFGEVPRPGHADYPSIVKYKSAQAGGGFFSGRMTAAFVMAGAVAKKLLEAKGVQTLAFSRQIGKVRDGKGTKDSDVRKNAYLNVVRAADLLLAKAMQKEIESAKAEGDSVGGVVECRVIGLPAGCGEPMFQSIEGRLSQAMFAIPAVKGVEFGAGFAAAALKGSQNNDEFVVSGGKIATKTNNAGGILGGLSTGMPIVFRVAFKPTSSIQKPQATANVKTMKEEKLVIAGRHDPCIAIRAVPVVECVAAICIADAVLADGEGNEG